MGAGAAVARPNVAAGALPRAPPNPLKLAAGPPTAGVGAALPNANPAPAPPVIPPPVCIPPPPLEAGLKLPKAAFGDRERSEEGEDESSTYRSEWR